MKVVKCFVLIIIITLFFLFCSCAKVGSDFEADKDSVVKNASKINDVSKIGSVSKIELSPSNKSLIDLTTKIYDEQKLSEIVNFNGSIDQLNVQYPIECIREDYETYRVSYLGNDSVAVLVFDNNYNKIFGKIYSTYLLKSNFDSLTKGQKLEEVRRIDPNGEYLFLFTGRNDTPKDSSHYTKDGYLITIEYDVSNNIINIEKELI